MDLRIRRSGITRRGLRGAIVALALPFAAGACNDILDVHVPGRVQEEALNDPALAPTIVASVIASVKRVSASSSTSRGVMSGPPSIAISQKPSPSARRAQAAYAFTVARKTGRFGTCASVSFSSRTNASSAWNRAVCSVV